MNFYEINEDTLAIIPVDSKNSKVIEGDNQYVVSKSAYNIMDESCQYYGSSYSGRVTAAKDILKCAYKTPILVEETRKLIFFPTKSAQDEDCCWFNCNTIKSIEKNGKQSLITLKNNDQIVVDSSKLSLENQIYKSTKLGYILQQRSKLK